MANFTCPEGKVLPLEKRCDSVPDCKNAEDENDCILSEEDRSLFQDYDDQALDDYVDSNSDYLVDDYFATIDGNGTDVAAGDDEFEEDDDDSWW